MLKRPLLTLAQVALMGISVARDVAGQETGTRSPVIAIERATIVDVERGALLRDQTILVQGQRIRALGPSNRITVPTDAERIDGRLLYVIPGLWDMHVHYPQNDTLRRMFLHHGVTGVREMGTSIDRVVQNRRDIEAGRWSGPRLITSVLYLDGATPSGYRQAGVTLNPATPDEARAAVDSVLALRPDFVKVLGEFPRDVFNAVADAARRRNVRIAGHWPTDVPFEDLIRAQPASIEHMLWASTTCLHKNAAQCAARTAELAPERLAVIGPALARANIWMTPTLVNQRRRAFLGDSALDDDPRLAMIPQEIVERWRADTNYHRRVPAVVRTSYDREVAAIPTLHRAGVRFLAGTDGPGQYLYAGVSLQDEIILLAEAGLTPLGALQSATRNPAIFLGASDSLGTVTEGKLADLVLLEGNPLDDVRNVRRVRGVMIGGRWARRP